VEASTERAPRLIYIVKGNIYVNVTNACTADCVFCPRRESAVIGGQDLRLDVSPDPADYVAAVLGALEVHPATEVVFCGFGEPTIRMDVLEAVARSAHDRGLHVRLNTNGHGALFNGRPILPDLRELIDSMCVSLNAGNEERYEEIVRPSFPNSFGATIAFIEGALREGIDVVATVVDTLSEDELAEAHTLAEKLGVPLRVRPWKDTW